MTLSISILIASVHVTVSLNVLIAIVLGFLGDRIWDVEFGGFLRGFALKFLHTGGCKDLTNSNRKLDSCN